MIFISAQPDDFYFFWQIKLQVFNFIRLGISSNNIHVLISYSPKKGLSSFFKNFIEENENQVKFYIYPDTRKRTGYASSIRPHIIAKHFRANPWLANESIFYHDSDIIFTKLPAFEKLLEDDVWYASDTRDYTNSHYIKSKIGYVGFKNMSELMGISANILEQHDNKIGGAQYLLKNVNTKFWEKLEIGCERMYEYLNDLNNDLTQDDRETKQIQAWCTDMWCLWWQAIAMGKTVNIHPELNFLWAHTPISSSNSVSILHYTGDFPETETRYFKKNNYSRCSPFYDDLSSIDHQFASGILVEEIKKYNQDRLENRVDLSDVSFLIPIRIDSEHRLENLRIVTNYILSIFKTKILILEADTVQRVELNKLSDDILYQFVVDNNPLFHRTKYNNKLVALSNTPIVALYDTDVVLPFSQVMESVDKLRKKVVDVMYPYDGTFVGIDMLMKAMFSKLMDIEMLEMNKGKHTIATERSWGGCIFFNKESFFRAGGENEYLTSWGPDDLERKKRMQVLGYKIERTKGNLYHLPHPRLTNSRYSDPEEQIKLVNEYLNVGKMCPVSLKKYVNTWPWIQKLSEAI